MPKLTDEELKKKLTPLQYNVLREKGTEAPFTGQYYDNHETGMYECGACGTPLFSSENKYDSNCGWPSFWQAADNKKIEFKEDDRYGMHRTEVLCTTCGSHLGHLFDDPTTPSGDWYCINSAALNFKKKE